MLQIRDVFQNEEIYWKLSKGFSQVHSTLSQINAIRYIIWLITYTA